MKWGERDVSLYEIIHGHGARWYWDLNYIPESELEEQEPPPAPLLAAIDSALEECKMKSVAWERRERKVRIDLVKDLIKLNMLTCKPISQRRDTRELAAHSTRKLAVAEHETRPMATEHAR